MPAPMMTVTVAAIASIGALRLGAGSADGGAAGAGAGVCCAGAFAAGEAETSLTDASDTVLMTVPSAVVMSGSPGAATPLAASRIASANSAAVLKRSSGRFAIALAITESNGFGTCTLSLDGGGGSTLSTLCMMVVAGPENGRSPGRNS